MSHIIPYIPTEPPSIHDDSFDNESFGSEVCEYNLEKTITEIPNIDPVNEPCPSVILNHSIHESNETECRSPLELQKHIESVIEKNNLNVDCTDFGNGGGIDDDVISQCSFEGQFDEYINNISNDVANDDVMMAESIQNLHFVDPFNHNLPIENNNMESFDCDFADFGAFKSSEEPQNQTADSFNINSKCISNEEQSENIAFTDFSVPLQPAFDVVDCAGSMDFGDADDDFDDFATFDNDTAAIKSAPLAGSLVDASIEDIVLSYREKLMAVINNIDLDVATHLDAPDQPPPLTGEIGAHIWRELTNFDYSPAFVFPWIQSACCERLMSALGPAFLDLLAAHRTALPLCPAALQPLQPIAHEPVPAPSTTSSTLDLAAAAPAFTDIKNLEDEFVFCGVSGPPMEAGGSRGPSETSVVLRSLLGGLTGGGQTQVHPEAEAVLRELPDLGYMTSRVLMFPVVMVAGGGEGEGRSESL